MFPKYFLVFCCFALLVAVVSCNVVKPEGADNSVQSRASNDKLEARNPGLAIAVKILRSALKRAAGHCLEQAANNCRNDWKNPKALVKCGKRFMKANQGRCVVG